MKKYLPLALLLGVPLLLIFAYMVIVGFPGSASNDPRSDAIAMQVGVLYGVYAVVAFLLWLRRRSPSQRNAPWVVALAAGGGAFVSNAFVHQYFNQPPSIDQALVKTASEMNSHLPMMIDSETRFDAAGAFPNKTILYRYTLVNRNAADIQKDKLIAVLRPKIVNNYRTNDGMKAFREHGVTMKFQYSDKAGIFITEIEVGPKDLGDK